MARLLVFGFTVALGAWAGLMLVSESAAVTREGYRTAELERERHKLVEENRGLEARVQQLKTATHLMERVKSLELEVVSPEESLKGLIPKPPRTR